MQCSAYSGKTAAQRADCLVIGVFEARELGAEARAVDRAVRGRLKKLLQRGDFAGRAGESMLLADLPGLRASRLLLVGLGAAKGYQRRAWRRALVTSVTALARTRVASMIVALERPGERELDDYTLALFVLGPPSTLQLADTRSGNAETLARGINRSLLRIPRTGTISFVDKDEDGSLVVRELDPKTKTVTTLVGAVAGAKEADLAWTPDGMLLMAENDVLYGWTREDRGWKRLADLAALGTHGVTRIAVSPKGNRIAFVASTPVKN